MPGDDDILAAIIGGDRTAWGRAYTAHSKKMFGTAMAVVRNRDDANEAVQEAFSSVMTTNPATLGKIDDLGQYLVGIVHNKAVDIIRRNAPTKLIDPDDAVTARRRDRGPTDVDEAVIDRIALEDAFACFDHMPPKVRYAMEERWLRRRPAKDVAAELAVKPQYVSQLIAKGVAIIDERSAFIERDPTDSSPPSGTTRETKDPS